MHTHTQSKAKAKLAAAVTQLLPPSDNTGMLGTTQTLEPSATNPPGAGLVTRRRTVQVSQIEVAEPKLHNGLVLLNKRWTVEHLLPQIYTRYPLMLQLGGLLPQFTLGTHLTAG